MKYLTYPLIVVAMVLGLNFLAPKVQALYNPFSKVCQGHPEAAVCKDSEKPQDIGGSNSILGVDGILMKAAGIVSIIIGLASVIMVIIGGLKYVLSQGDANSTNSAKNTVLYAAIGLAIAAMAQVIIAFIINRI